MRFLRFVLTNLCGTAVELLVLLGLSRVFHSVLAVYGLAPVLAFECAVLTNFLVAYLWSFGDRVDRTIPDFRRRLAGYHTLAVGVFLGRLALMAGLGWASGLDVVLCNAITLLFSGLISFGAQDRLIFSASPAR